MLRLDGVRVLIVEDHDDSRELMEMVLTSAGADVALAGSVSEALVAMAPGVPDVLLSDLHLPEQDGFSLIRAVRARSDGKTLPAIAVTGRADRRSQELAAEAGFSKVMVKPIDPLTLASAVVGVMGAADSAGDSVEELLAKGDIRGALARLNAATTYRYTSVLRFDGEQLSSVWSFDRKSPAVDDFPLGMPISASYCRYLTAEGGPFAVVDARLDGRTAGHPKVGVLNAYCGVPILAPDGSVYGSLCHFDEDPQPVDARIQADLARAATLLPPRAES